MNLPIYLDHHATTPLDERVLDEMMPYLTKKFGNSSSMDHTYGSDALSAVDTARKKIADVIHSKANEIIFTSGATESNNLALIGTMNKYADRGDHLITCTTEHKAVLDVADYLKDQGKKITRLSVNECGEIDLEELRREITDKTVMISIMTANNEVGTIADIKGIGKLAHEKKVIFHTDAAQAVGHIPMNVQDMNIDLMSFSAHKMYGPKGIGALYVRSLMPLVRPDPILHGGGHEGNMRSGTLNVPGIVGFGKAIEIAQKEMDAENKRFRKWSNMIIKAFTEIDGILNSPKNRLSHNINICFPGIESKLIIHRVSKDVAISAGSACTAEAVEPSHVLLAMGFDETRAHSSIRAGLGRFNTKEEIDYFIDTLTSKIDAFEHQYKQVNSDL